MRMSFPVFMFCPVHELNNNAIPNSSFQIINYIHAHDLHSTYQIIPVMKTNKWAGQQLTASVSSVCALFQHCLNCLRKIMITNDDLEKM